MYVEKVKGAKSLTVRPDNMSLQIFLSVSSIHYLLELMWTASKSMSWVVTSLDKVNQLIFSTNVSPKFFCLTSPFDPRHHQADNATSSRNDFPNTQCKTVFIFLDRKSKNQEENEWKETHLVFFQNWRSKKNDFLTMKMETEDRRFWIWVMPPPLLQTKFAMYLFTPSLQVGCRNT